MTWLDLEGHDELVERFRRNLRRNKLGSALLFVGPAGVGKHHFALRLAQALLCTQRPAALLDPCGQCDACVQVLAGTHPDLDAIGKPADKAFIPVASFIGEGDQRMREGLCHRIALKPFMGGRKIAIIDDADSLNEEGANCLLKTLEEPPPLSLLILIGTNAEKQLPTVRSRCQIIRFKPLDARIVASILVRSGAVSDAAQAERLAAESGGSIELAQALADPDLWTFREQFLQHLAALPAGSVRLGQELSAFVEQAGKEASDRRARARQVVTFAIHFYSALMRALAGAQPERDTGLNVAVAGALARNHYDLERVAQAIDRCLEAMTHIDRNAHQATLLEAWVDDLRAVSRVPPAAAMRLEA